jgi:hypothetical protein
MQWHIVGMEKEDSYFGFDQQEGQLFMEFDRDT